MLEQEAPADAGRTLDGEHATVALGGAFERSAQLRQLVFPLQHAAHAPIMSGPDVAAKGRRRLVRRSSSQ
jgi:hypothetical protein